MIKKLLLGMFLWLPLLYTVLFIIISLLTGMIGGNWGFYFLGLSVSLIACVVLTYLYAHRSAEDKRDEKEQPSADVRPVPQLPMSDEEAAVNVRDEANRYAAEMKAGPSAVGGERYDAERAAYLAGGRYIDPAPAPDPASSADSLGSGGIMGADGLNDYYYGSGKAAPRRSSGDADFSPYVQPSNYGGDDGIRLSDYDGARRREEEPAAQDPPLFPSPKIFRLRGEPNVLLYEYPTEFRKYYVNADGSLKLLSTQKK